MNDVSSSDKPRGKVRMGRPPKISREQVVAAALNIGLTDLTLTAVAEALGVTLQALYYHVRDREELIDLVTEQLMAHVPIPPHHGEDWCEWAYGFAYALKRLYEAAPGLADRAVEKTQTTPGVLSRFDISIRIALRSGFDEATALWATRAITELANSWVSREQRRDAAALRNGVGYTDGLIAAAESQTEVDISLLVRCLRKTKDQSSDVRFDFTLRSLLLGISSHRHAALPGEATTGIGAALPSG